MGNVSSDANLEAWKQWCPSTTSYHNNVAPSSQIEWLSLPEELVMMILDKLLESIDYVRFAAVCKQWYRLAKDKYTRDTDRWHHRRRPPMLLLPPSPTKKSINGRRTLCSISQGTTYNIQLLQDVSHPIDDNTYCCGSGHSWLAIVSEVADLGLYLRNQWHIKLVNPFWSATTLTLPLVHRSSWGAPKVILSSDPALNPYDFWVLAFFIEGSSLAIHKRGEDDWTRIEIVDASFTDAIFYNGSFYAVDDSLGRIVSFNVEEVESHVLSIGGFKRHEYWGRSYLVESTKGELLCLKRTVKRNRQLMLDWDNVTTSFRVYKLELDNQSSSTMTMVDVADIEDETLFVGDTPSVSVLASNFCGCQPNSIYYTDDSLNFPPPQYFKDIPRRYPQGINSDTGVFNLADETILPYNGRHFSPPVWITAPPPFDPVPGSNLTQWTGSNSSELTRARASKKSRFKHWLSCFPSEE